MDFVFCPGFNCFYGKNGVGKTNVLDALHFLCNGKSYFSRSDGQSIAFDEDFAVLEANVKEEKDETLLHLSLQHNGKKNITKNGVKVKRLADYVGWMPAVMITPGDILMLTGHSEERRKFMDKSIGYSNQSYLKALMKHNKLLESRNEMLKQFALNQRQDLLALESIDHLLIPLIDYIHSRRGQFLQELEGKLTEVYQQIVKSEEQLTIGYASALNEQKAVELLKSTLQHDLYAQRTTNGAHKDDLDVTINDVSVKKYGSQGQIKSATIALNLAAYLYLAEKSGKKPLLLLDDVFEKIDDQRSERLLELISNPSFGQIFITDTSQKRIKSKLKQVTSDKKFFNIERD